MIEPVVDEVIEPNVVVTRQSHGPGGTGESPQKPGRSANGDKRQRKQQSRQLDHAGYYAPRSDLAPFDIQAHGRVPPPLVAALLAKATLSRFGVARNSAGQGRSPDPALNP
ncbi:MAG: hypothetical protein ACRET5_20325 [Steroidobacteraceae bacterium]